MDAASPSEEANTRNDLIAGWLGGAGQFSLSLLPRYSQLITVPQSVSSSRIRQFSPSFPTDFITLTNRRYKQARSPQSPLANLTAFSLRRTVLPARYFSRRSRFAIIHFSPSHFHLSQFHLHFSQTDPDTLQSRHNQSCRR